MRKFLLITIWIFIIVLFPVIAYVYDNISYKENVPYISSIVGIEYLNYEIEVKRDNSIDVLETITFNFVEGMPFDGIKVNLPLRDNIHNRRNLRLGEVSSEDVSIDHKRRFNYDELHLAKHNDDMVAGMYTYTLKYHYDLGDTYDDFIYKIFSNRFNTGIMNMNLEFKFEENIDPENVKILSNGTEVTDRITYGVENNYVRASLSDFILNSDIIIEIGLDNYFNKKNSTNGFISLIMLITIILLTIIILIVNIIKHKKQNDIEENYSLDIKYILIYIGLILLELFTYLFIHDLPSNLFVLYYVTYGIIALCGLIMIIKLRLKNVD